MNTKITRLLAVAATLALVAAACTTTDEEAAGTPTPTATAGNASVRVAHFSPDAPNVDVYVDGNRVLSDVPFQAVSDYLDVPEGTHTFEVRPAGADPGSDPVIDATATLVADQGYTVAALGRLDGIKPGLIEDDLTQPESGNAHVRAIHAIPDAPAVDVAVQGGDVVIEALEFGQASDYLPVPAGDYTFEIRAAGTDQALLTFSGTLAEGTITSVAAIGSVDLGTAAVEAYQDN